MDIHYLKTRSEYTSRDSQKEINFTKPMDVKKKRVVPFNPKSVHYVQF